METKALKKQLGAAIAMVLVAAIALGAATFAWFVNNNAVTATGVDVSTSSAVPNLYINSTGQTTGVMATPVDPDNPTNSTNPSALYPVSTNDAKTFYETLHWTSGTGNYAVADQYQTALVHEEGKTVYADYTFDLGVANGKMNVYFDGTNYKTDNAATTLKANPDKKMGTAGRFAISFDNGNTWKLFKVDGTSVTDSDGKATGYYTDKGATTGDYWVKQVDGTLKADAAQYADFSTYAGSVDAQGQVQAAGKTALTTLDSANADNHGKVKVIVRVWYEGCDKDCVSENAQKGIPSAITGNLGFVGVQTA